MRRAASNVARPPSVRIPIRMFHAALPPENDGIVTEHEGKLYQWFGLGWAAFERAAEICRDAELAGGAA